MLQSSAYSPPSAPTCLLIDGEWVQPASGKHYDCVNPSTGKTVARVADGDATDVDRAVKAARSAFDDGPWSRMHPADRGRIIYALAQLVRENAQQLAEIDAIDAGKPVTNSLRLE